MITSNVKPLFLQTHNNGVKKVYNIILMMEFSRGEKEAAKSNFQDSIPSFHCRIHLELEQKGLTRYREYYVSLFGKAF